MGVGAIPGLAMWTISKRISTCLTLRSPTVKCSLLTPSIGLQLVLEPVHGDVFDVQRNVMAEEGFEL